MVTNTLSMCGEAHEIWIAIERLQQCESLNIQDVKTNLFWEFGKFTSHDGESMELYYSRFYKMMNEMTRNNLTVATMHFNVQFLQQLQPEWSRFVTIVKQQHDFDTVSYHKLFDVLKQYQKEVNEIRAERIAKNANPLALVAAAQQYPDPYYKASKSYKLFVPPSKQASSTRSNASTKFKGKEIAKPITPSPESASEEDSYPEQAQRDKDMKKNLALIAKYFKKIYKPTNNNLGTSSNFRNKNVDTTPRYKNDNQTGQFGNQRTVTVTGARETVGSQEKMLLYKQAEKGVSLQAEQADWLEDTDDEIDEQELEAHYSYMAKIQEQPEFTSNTCLVEEDDSNVTPASPDMCDNDIQIDQNAEDERDALANLIANLKLDVDENKNIQKQLKKANASLTQELKECKSILAETSRTLGESNSIRDSCLVALQNKQTEFERYKALNDRTVDYDKLERKLNETLGLLAQKDIDIKEGLKLKAYEISVVKEKHDELVKQSLLTKSHYEGLVKEKTKVITDLKLKEEKDIDKMISMEKQLKFLNEIVYKRNQSIQTIHMLAPKGPTFNGRPTFANPMYLKKAQYEKPCLYEIPYDQSDPANRLVPDREETLTLEKESRSKLNKDLVRPYDYTKLNSLYEIFKPASQEYHEQLAHANEVRKKMWRKSFVKFKPNIFKNIGFLPVSKSISKSRQAYNVMTNNINHFRELVDQAWEKHSHNHFCAPTALDMEVLIKTCLMPLAIKTQNDSFTFVHELKQEMHADLKYVESLENEIDELESDKAEFSNMYDILLQEYLKAQLQDKNIAISELKKLIEKCKGNYVETKFDKSYVVRQPNAQRILKLAVLGKPAPFSDSLERKSFSQTKLVPKTNVSKSLSKPVTTQILPQAARQAVRNTNVIKPDMYQIDTRTTQTRASQLPQTFRNTNPRVSTSTGVIHNTNVSRPQLKSTQIKDKVVPNNSQVKDTKTKVEDHPRISSISNKTKSIVQLILFIVDSGCTKHMTGNLKLLCNFVENYLVGQFCDADLKVAFRKSTCFVRDLQGNNLLTGNRRSDLYTISLQETTTSTPIYLMAKASLTQAWLWHRRLSHLNFDYINLLSKKDVVIGLPKLKYVKDQLCSSCEVSKAKRSSFKKKTVPSLKGRLNLLHMDLCGPMRVASINRKKYILVIVGDYSRYTWTLFLRSKDETPEVLKDFLIMIQQNLQAPVIFVLTDRGT
ncbi:gag-pol polyprotein [Tanacetum coccineum]|uniref:Gag-pol polyprotein n=1 Tax=Tanacetum coccineum TaxID=301880 RepID=A0ABQ5I0S7_9ASTR